MGRTNGKVIEDIQELNRGNVVIVESKEMVDIIEEAMEIKLFVQSIDKGNGICYYLLKIENPFIAYNKWTRKLVRMNEKRLKENRFNKFLISQFVIFFVSLSMTLIEVPTLVPVILILLSFCTIIYFRDILFK